MTLEQLRKLAADLHRKANASSGISPLEDINEWMGTRLDEIIENDSYQLEDILDEQQNTDQVIQYLNELYHSEHPCL